MQKNLLNLIKGKKYLCRDLQTQMASSILSIYFSNENFFFAAAGVQQKDQAA